MAFFHFEGNGPAGQGDPQPHVVWQQREKKARKPRKAIGNGVTRTLINLGVTLLFAAVYFYVALPPMNLHSEEHAPAPCERHLGGAYPGGVL